MFTVPDAPGDVGATATALDTTVFFIPSNHVRGLHVPGFRPGYCIESNCPGPHTCDWREPLDSDANRHAVKPAMVRSTVRSVLDTVYATEAHVAGYVLMRDGRPLDRQPRIRKDSLPWLRAQGFEVYLTCFLADWDTPGHVPWTPELLDAFNDLWASGRGPLATCGLYLSPKGARLIQPLRRPVVVEEGEARLRTWLDELVGAGVDPGVTAVKDWTRLMRTPHHRRDSGAQVRAPRIDRTRMVSVDPPPPTAPRFAPKRHTPFRPVDGATVLPLFGSDVPAGWESTADAIGAAIRDTVRDGQYRRCYLALAGALCARGCPLEGIPAIVARAHSVDRSYDTWEGLLGDRVEIARSTVYQFANHQTVLGYNVLRDEFPRVADALDATTTTAAEGRVLRQLAARGPAPMPVADAVAVIARALEEARTFSGVTVIAAPPGTGKTQAVAAHAATLPPIVDRAAPGARLAVSSATHNLARQTAAKLPRRSLHVFSPPSMLKPDGTPVCIYASSAQALANGRQSVRRELCEGRGKYPCELASTCPAHIGHEGEENANLVTGVHGLVRELLGYAGVKGTFVIDEPDEITVTERITLDDLETARRYLDSFVPRYATAIAPALAAFTAWVRSVGPIEASIVSVQDAVRAGAHLVPAEELGDIDPLTPAADLGDAILVDAAGAILDDARSKAPPLVWRSVVLARASAARAVEIGRASRVLDILWRGITSAIAFGARLDEQSGDRAVTVVSINRDLTDALAHTGHVVILDANAGLHMPALTKVLGNAPKLIELAVADGAPIARTVLACGAATRASWLPRGAPDWEAGILSALRAVVAWLNRDPSTRRVGLIAPHVIEAAIAYTLRPDDPAAAGWTHSKKALTHARELLSPVLGAFTGEILTGHYQALRGLDHMADCDAIVTLMDPRRNLGDVHLRAEYLSLDPEGRVDALAAAELQQAHGRLRTIHRTRPGRQLHVGAIVPAGWAGLPVTVETLAIGRPRNVAAMPASELQEARASTGQSQAAFAKTIRCGVSALKHYEAGNRPVPEDVARAVRAVVPVGSKTPHRDIAIQGFRNQRPTVGVSEPTGAVTLQGFRNQDDAPTLPEVLSW